MKNKFYSTKFKKIKVITTTKNEIQKIINAINFIESTDKSHFKRITEIKAILVFPKKDYDNELFPKEKHGFASHRQ